MLQSGFLFFRDRMKARVFMNEKILQMVQMVNPDVPSDPETKLIDEGYVDSFGAYMILAQIELEFGIAAEESEMCYDNFKDIRSIAAFVSRKLEAKR